ncbi:MAG: DUF2155 domain-containing protein [Hyphomicrobiales bacterium]|nr:DUF2155 domain-containing protein [Hyphomicrobiales bacterium]
MRIDCHARGFLGAVTVAAIAAFAPGNAMADKIKNPTAVFAGLDKITGRIISFEVAIDETVQFGSLQITPRVCYTRPPTEAPQTTSFVEVEEVLPDKKFKKVFSGWMFSSSPGLHGVEHPVYDAWLTDCKGGTEIIKTAKPKEEQPLDEDLAKEGSRTLKTTSRRRGDEEDAPKPAARRAPTRKFYPQNPGRGGVNPFGTY